MNDDLKALAQSSRAIRSAFVFLRVCFERVLWVFVSIMRALPAARGVLYIPPHGTSAVSKESLRLSPLQGERDSPDPKPRARLWGNIPIEAALDTPPFLPQSNRPVYRLNKCSVRVAYAAAYFDQKDQIIPSLSPDRHIGGIHAVSKCAYFQKPTHLPGLSLSLITPEASNNYYHWMVDLLCKLAEIKARKLKLRDFDHVLINHTGRPYQLESLLKAGISASQIVQANAQNHFLLDECIVVAERAPRFGVHPSEITWLRDIFLPAEKPEGVTGTRLFISRDDAAYRKLNPQCENLIRNFGFEKISLGGKSISQQAALFSSAALIVGLHGAAMTNTMFCKASARVLEIFANGWVLPCFANISKFTVAEYGAFVDRKGAAIEHVISHQRSDIRPDPTLFNLVLKEFIRGN